MNAERLAVRGLAGAVLAAVLAAFSPGQKTAPKTPAPSTPLIRMEWLQTPSGSFVPPRRDIFSPQGGSAAGDEEGVPVRRGNPAARAAEKKAEEEAKPAWALRYIGYSRSAASKKIVALVVIDGRAEAVAEGDTMGGGYKVVRITLKEIEILAPDGTTLQFAWTGADR